MASNPQKQLINSVETCVDDMLEGVVATYPHVRKLRGHRVVLREDFEELKSSGKVTVLSGGGSGHEPFCAGYVGANMLTGIIAGSVFTSPPPNDILAAIKAVASPAGTLLVVINYTGDRLNFGIAAERARAEGIKVETITVAEDCALTSTDKTAGRRGLCGSMLVFKIAGTLAEEGRPIEEIARIATEAANSMGTIGIGLTPCNVPGSGASFSLGNDEMELGLGVHGEAGVKRMKMTPAKSVITTMINHMTDQTTASHIKIASGDRVAIVLNNLGATSVLEFNIVIKEAIAFLEDKGVVVERVLTGHLMTSLDMAGVALTIMHLDDTRRRCLEKDTTAFAYPRQIQSKTFVVGSKRIGQPEIEGADSMETTGKDEIIASDIEPGNKVLLIEAIRSACDALIENEGLLNDLDKAAGDNDCGMTLKTGAQGIKALLDSFPQMTPYAMFVAMATSVESSIGGASGALYSLFLSAAAVPLRKSTDFQGWCDALNAATKAISKYGGAEPGDRTMLDPLHAACQTLQPVQGNSTPAESFQKAVQAAEEVTKATTHMKAKAGRASYVNPELLTKPDAGATAVTLWLRAACDVMGKRK
ncbi:triokinase/FMN cyclase-like isoform X1 [Ptychodera flava]|uniref:triokinase/FMN cyclase-like isoform X1 n=1 Tax=Ptychodera flava TaxID=63121 RepID=UPI00396AB0BF